MKTYALSAALCFLFIIPSSAKIKNGYAVDIESARGSLKTLQSILKDDKNLSIFQRFTIKNEIAHLTEFVTYYELTELWLDQFKIISPDQYYHIDSLKDRLARRVDVYVKFVPEKQMPNGVAATTTMDPDKDDKDACVSEYGIHTVCVKVAVVKKSLHLLAHEFGHVAYQAPNLATYFQFYKKYYLASTFKFKSVGHNDNDPSGQEARAYVRRFREQQLQFNLTGKKTVPYLVLLQRIKNHIQNGNGNAEVLAN